METAALNSIAFALAWALTAAAPSARAASPETRDQVDGNLIQFNDNGSWCWYQDERALVDKARGKLIIGSVASAAGAGGAARDGNVEAVIYDLHTGARQISVLTTGEAHRFGCDDHDAPAFLLRPDGKYLAFYAGHNKDHFSYYRIYAGDAWGPESAFDWNSRPGGADFPTTYSNPHYLPGEGRLYNFSRGTGHGSQNIMLSTNLGDTWSYAGLMTTNAGVGYVNGYFRYHDDGQRIDFICTEFHPRDFNTSIYHGYISNGHAFNSAGTVVNSNIFSQSPVAPQSFTPVFLAGSVLPPGQTNSHCWNMDVRRFPDGSISALVSARVNDPPGQRSEDPDHAFIFCRYDGRSWAATYLCNAGKKLFRSEQDYTGLGALSPDDPTVIYISTPFDPRDNATFLGVHEIFKGVTADRGATFAWTPVTQHSTRDNLRPIVPAWDKNHTALLWWRGTSFTSQRFDAAVVGLIFGRD
jgi:hypothetical protein